MQAKEKNKPTPRVVIKKVIHADRNRVFDAWTKPEVMNDWYVGGKGTSKCSVDLRVGGKYTNEMLIETGDCAKEGCSGEGIEAGGGIKSYLHQGEYLEIIRPERLVFTWNSPSVQNTVVTIELREVDSGTEVTLTHELSAHEDCASHEQGWTYALNGLASRLG